MFSAACDASNSMWFFPRRIKCSVNRKKITANKCSCLPIASNLHPFKIFWHLVLYSFAIANPRFPVSTRLNETCFPTDLCSLLCNSTFFLLTANGQISPHCLLCYHLAGETVLWLVWDCARFVWPLSRCQTECITAMFCLPFSQNWNWSGFLSSTQSQIFIKHEIHWEFHLSDLIERDKRVQNPWRRERQKENRQTLVEVSLSLESESSNKYLRIILLIMWQFTSSVKCQATV